MRPENQGDVRKELAKTRHEIKGEITELRGEMAGMKGEIRNQGVLMEQLRSNVEQIAEGVIFLQDQIKANREERAGQFSQLESLLRLSYSSLDRRVSKLEERFST